MEPALKKPLGDAGKGDPVTPGGPCRWGSTASAKPADPVSLHRT